MTGIGIFASPTIGCHSSAGVMAGVNGIHRQTNPAPKEHSRAIMIVLGSDQIEDLTGQNSPAPIFRIQILKPLRPLGQRLDRRKLKRLEHARIHLALYL